jgi:hypothetical protein
MPQDLQTTRALHHLPVISASPPQNMQTRWSIHASNEWNAIQSAA